MREGLIRKSLLTKETCAQNVILGQLPDIKVEAQRLVQSLLREAKVCRLAIVERHGRHEEMDSGVRCVHTQATAKDSNGVVRVRGVNEECRAGRQEQCFHVGGHKLLIYIS